MSRPFNNQWILDRADPARGTARAPAGHPGEAKALVHREVLPAHRRERSRAVRRSAGLYKRPKWIDRDT